MTKAEVSTSVNRSSLLDNIADTALQHNYPSYAHVNSMRYEDAGSELRKSSG